MASRLLAIFAHPDDESFGPGGTLARYAHQGVEVHVCIVTDGAAGTFDPRVVSHDEASSLTHVRQQELICACRVLDVQLHMLGYRDSGMEGDPQNQHPASLYQADLNQVIRDVVRVIRQVRPHVVITHDPTGGYFHPDHVRVCQVVNGAWDEAGDTHAFPDLGAKGLSPWRPARLYYTVIPRSMTKWFVRIMRLLRQDPRHFGRNKDTDVTQLGVPDDQIHVQLDIGPYLEVKAQASDCHKSQGGGGILRMLPTFLRRRVMRYEHFVQARPADAQPHHDLFDGLACAV